MADQWKEDKVYQVNGLPDSIKLKQLNNLLYDALIATGHVKNCVLINRQNLEIEAKSEGYQPSLKQISELVNGFKNSSRLRKEGLYFNNLSHKCIRADKYSIYAKSLKEKTPSGFVAVRTAAYVLVATFIESMFTSVCIEATEKLAEYLREKGR